MSSPVLVIGAGPYGVGIADELHESGLDVRVVGEPFELWRRHTLSIMRLRSPWQSSAIHSPAGRYDVHEFLSTADAGVADPRQRTGIRRFRSYLEWVEGRMPFPVVRSRVTQLAARPGGGFRADLGEGDGLEVGRVVLATGNGPFRHLPEALHRLPAGRVAHSWETERIESLSGGRALVIGSGQSAAESVAALIDRNEVTWSFRRPPVFFREPLRLPGPLFDAVLSLSPLLYGAPAPVRRALSSLFRPTVTPDLRRLLADERVRTQAADAADLGLRPAGDGVVDGQDRRFDLVVAATGFRVRLSRLPYLDGALRRSLVGPRGDRPLDGSFQTAVPGLYAAGALAEPTFGPAQRFILGSWTAARRIGRALGAEGSRRPAA